MVLTHHMYKVSPCFPSQKERALGARRDIPLGVTPQGYPHPERIGSHPGIINPPVHPQLLRTGEKHGDAPCRYASQSVVTPRQGCYRRGAGVHFHFRHSIRLQLNRVGGANGPRMKGFHPRAKHPLINRTTETNQGRT